MSLTQSEIETTYLAILDRTPSAPEEKNVLQRHASVKTLRRVILGSEEFYLKFKSLRAAFEAGQTPILVHPVIPGTAGDALLDALAAAPELQPARQTGEDGVGPLRRMPRHERLKLRLVQGDVDFSAGDGLELPHRNLCVLRRPGPRLWRVWRLLCPPDDTPEAMSFGEFLDYSLDSVPHRLEMDNGQVRRLAGSADADDIGAEPALLRRALHKALDPDTILGLAEYPASVLEALADREMIAAPDAALPEDPDDTAGLDKALAELSDAQRAIFQGYTAWDEYLYEVCAALLFPPFNKKATSA